MTINAGQLLMLLFIAFMAGGAAGTLIIGPRLRWQHGAPVVQLRQLPVPPPRPEPEQLLRISAVVPAGQGVPELRAAALERAHEVHGPLAVLEIASVKDLYTMASGKLCGDVFIRCLSEGQEACGS